MLPMSNAVSKLIKNWSAVASVAKPANVVTIIAKMTNKETDLFIKNTSIYSIIITKNSYMTTIYLYNSKSA